MTDLTACNDIRSRCGQAYRSTTKETSMSKKFNQPAETVPMGCDDHSPRGNVMEASNTGQKRRRSAHLFGLPSLLTRGNTSARFSTSTRRLRVVVTGAVALVALALPATPAQAVASHIWPVCSRIANESGWRWQTRWDHSPPLGVDINWGPNTESDAGRWVVASAGGTIHSKPVAAPSSYGKQVILRHGADDYTQYAHLDWVTSLAPGTSVVKGQKIGTIGNSSGGSAYHLHYEQRQTATGSLRKAVIGGTAIPYPAKYAAPINGTFKPTHISASC